MKESGVWSYLRNGMAGRWHATRIESSAGNGVPDVNFALPTGTSGWIELKYIPEWPKRSDTLIKLPLRPEQFHWIRTRGKMAGNVWVFTRIENVYFLLEWKEAVSAADGWDRATWMGKSHWPVGKLKFDEFEEALDYGC